MKTADVQGHSVIGVYLAESYQFPFTIKIKVGNIGGPSAGMMFALGIVDKLTPDGLTGGKFIAGTGEISANGTVAPIGGIQQKMAGARAAGATWFLTPAANCPDTSGAVPAGLQPSQSSHAAPGAERPRRDQGGPQCSWLLIAWPPDVRGSCVSFRPPGPPGPAGRPAARRSP